MPVYIFIIIGWKGIFTITMSTLLVDIHTVADVFLFDLGRFSFWYAVGAIPENVVYMTKKCGANKWFEKPFKTITGMRLFDFFRIIFSWFFWTISNAMQSWIVQSGVDQKWMLNPLLADSKRLFNTADTNSKALSAFQNRLYFFARANY